MKLFICLSILLSASVHASTTDIYTLDGGTAPAEDARTEALYNKEVHKCHLMVAETNKVGTKPIKKGKVK